MSARLSKSRSTLSTMTCGFVRQLTEKASPFQGPPFEQPSPRRLEGSAFQPARRGKKGVALAGKPKAFRKAGRRSRTEQGSLPC
jgi:hypothetical protein